MATITISRKEFDKNVKLSGDVMDKIMMAGIAVDSIDEKEIVLDITASRPDLLSTQGIFRYLNAYYGKQTGLKKYIINKPEKNFKVVIDKSVRDVRPFTACAIVKNLKFDEEKIKQIIDLQEKLHNTVGRNRKKLAIGIYPLEKISLPIKFEARKPQDIRFIPLESPREMSGIQILSQHPTGRDYAHLLEGKDKFPVFVDAKNQILSMPPIINSHETGKVSYETRDIFVECSGFDLSILQKTLNIIITTLIDLGGKAYAMELNYNGKKIITPDFKPEKMKISIDNVNKIIGLNLKEAEVRKLLEKMGYDYANKVVSVPSWRADVIHEIDLIEDVAVAYGYENLAPEIPKVATIGEESEQSKKQTKIADILAGAGLLETSSLHLIKPEEVTDIKTSDLLELENSKSEYKYLRYNLLVPLLRVISQNSDATYPQKIYEIGTIFERDKENKTETGITERDNLAIALTDEKANFTEIKQLVDYLFRMLGVEYSIAEADNNTFILGRVGKIIINKKEVGVIGEVAPRVLKNWGINMPVAALELDLENI